MTFFSLILVFMLHMFLTNKYDISCACHVAAIINMKAKQRSRSRGDIVSEQNRKPSFQIKTKKSMANLRKV